MWTVLWASAAFTVLWLVLVDPSKEAVQNLVFWLVCTIVFIIWGIPHLRDKFG